MSEQLFELIEARLEKEPMTDLECVGEGEEEEKEERNFLIDTQEQNLIEDDPVESCSMDEEFEEETLRDDVDEHSFSLIETSNENLFNSYGVNEIEVVHQVSSQIDDKKEKDERLVQKPKDIEEDLKPLAPNTFPSETTESHGSYITSCRVRMEEIRKRKRNCELKVQDLLEECYQQIENVMSAMVHGIQQRYSSFHDKFQVTEANLEKKLESHYHVEKKLKTIAALLAQSHEEYEE